MWGRWCPRHSCPTLLVGLPATNTTGTSTCCPLCFGSSVGGKGITRASRKCPYTSLLFPGAEERTPGSTRQGEPHRGREALQGSKDCGVQGENSQFQDANGGSAGRWLLPAQLGPSSARPHAIPLYKKVFGDECPGNMPALGRWRQ